MVFLGSTNGQGGGTVTIAICFIVLAYILHPVVESAYHRIRAYFAWRAIEDNKFVEVTDYPMVTEVVWGRGKLDAARLIASSLLLFSIASWGLELCLGLVNIEDGDVDMFDRPPPVVFRNGDTGSWEVERKVVFTTKIEKTGTLGNFRHREGCDEDDCALEIGEATSLYRTKKNQKPPLEGVIVTAFWSTDVHDSNDDLYYNITGDGSGHATLRNLNCTDEASKTKMYIRGEEKNWGFVTMCEQGPKTHSAGGDLLPPPTIILINSSNDTYLIVEEVGSYPGFLYSVWSANSMHIENVTINHEFHIASRFRLVEAVITGIVFELYDGGKCVDLMFQFSEIYSSYDDDGRTRTQPFGERPGNNRGVSNLSEVEPIVDGVEADRLATTCLVLLTIVSSIGVIWSLFLRSNIGMDVYDRDELIRAVTLTDQGGEERRSTSLRMFVRKDETGRIDVIVSDTGHEKGFCGAFLRKPGVVAQQGPAVATAVVGSSDNPIPTGPMQIRLEGIRMGLGRTTFPRGFGPRSYSLTSSPVPSTMCTPMNRTPARGGERKMNELEARATAEGRKALGETESGEDSARTLPVGRSGYTSNISTSELQGLRKEGVFPPLPTTAQMPRQAGTSSTAVTSRPTRRRNFLPSISNLSSASNSTEARPEDSDSDTTFSSVNNE